jgi:hypothetical protein
MQVVADPAVAAVQVATPVAHAAQAVVDAKME